jgi:hypothetical protein
MDSYYSVHDKVTIRITQSTIDLKKNYDHYLRHFQTKKPVESPDYWIREYSDFKIPDEHLNVSNQYLGFNSGFCLPHEKYAITISGNGIVEYSDIPNRATNLWLQYLFVQKGMCLVHSAALGLYGKQFIFPAFGGAGKTTLISQLRNLDTFRFFSDDYSIIDKRGNLYTYPSDFSIYDYHLNTFQELQTPQLENFFLHRKKIRKLLDASDMIPGPGAFRKISRFGITRLIGGGIDYVKIPVSTLIPPEKIGTTDPLSAGIFLSRYNGKEIKIVRISPEKFIEQIIGVLKVEFKDSLIYLHLLAAFGALDLPCFEERQKSILLASFSGIALYQVFIPYSVSIHEYSDAITRLLGTVADENV